MKAFISIMTALSLSACARDEIARSAATASALGQAIQATDDLATAQRLAAGVVVLTDAIHQATDPAAQSLITAAQAAANPEAAVAKAEVQAERTVEAAEREAGLTTDLLSIGASLLLAFLGIQGGRGLVSLISDRRALDAVVRGVQAVRGRVPPDQRAAIDADLAAHQPGQVADRIKDAKRRAGLRSVAA